MQSHVPAKYQRVMLRSGGLFAMALAALILAAANPARATVLDSYTGGSGPSDPAGYFGQSFTTLSSGGPWDDITFNYFEAGSTTTTYALGTGFILTQAYFGSPAALSSSTAGFVGESTNTPTGDGSVYTFDPTLQLQAGTQYFFYENALVPQFAINGGGFDPPETSYKDFPSLGYTGFATDSDEQSLDFSVSGTTVPPFGGPPGVPEISASGGGSLAILLLGTFALLAHLRRSDEAAC